MLRFLIPLLLLPQATLAQTLESRVEGLQLIASPDLPFVPNSVGAREDCSGFFVDAPTTPAGQAIAAKGWRVTAELPFGMMTAVSFVADVIPAGLGGRCNLMDGRVGFFAKNRLVALLQPTDSSWKPGMIVLAIGKIQPLDDAGLRILNGDPFRGAVADLQPDGAGGITVLPVAAEDPLCTVSALVPNFVGLPIDQARRLILDAGWQNYQEPTAMLHAPLSQALAAAHITEFGGCGPGDQGHCIFHYSGPAGRLDLFTLQYGTDGNLPAVVDYVVYCGE